MKQVTLPKIICIGAQKCGTSWLHEALQQNPAVWSPPFKELHFFDYKFIPDSRKWAKWHVRSNVKRLLKEEFWHSEIVGYDDYLRSLIKEPMLNGNWYKNAFSIMPHDNFGMDITPEYCQLPVEGIEFLAKFLEHPKIIYIIRDPVDRAISQVRMNLARNMMVTEDIEAWEKFSNQPVVWQRGNYAEYVPRWDSFLSEDHILYIPFGRIAQEPHTLLHEIEKFLGIPAHKYEDVEKKVFSGKHTYIPDSIKNNMRDKMRIQYEFLENRFGQEFVRRT
jgi:hypothetical protein